MRKACWEWGVVAPDWAEQSANPGEEGEPHNFRKQGHQPVLRGSGEEGQRYGAAEPWGQRSIQPSGFRWSRRQTGTNGQLPWGHPHSNLTRKELLQRRRQRHRHREVKSFTQERLTTHYQAIIIKFSPGADFARASFSAAALAPPSCGTAVAALPYNRNCCHPCTQEGQ